VGVRNFQGMKIYYLGNSTGGVKKKWYLTNGGGGGGGGEFANTCTVNDKNSMINHFYNC
jgi:hypothetical protein